MRRVLLALVVVLATVSGASVVAADSDGTFGEFIGDDDEGTDWRAVVDGILSKNKWYVSNLLSVSDEDADQEAAESDRGDLQATFNANNQSIENYTNARFSGNASEWDVIAIHHVRDDGEATHYLVATSNNSTFSNAQMVNSTDRAVDKEVTLRGYASDNAHNELDHFISEFVAEDRSINRSYLKELATEYSGYVDEPFTDE